MMVLGIYSFSLCILAKTADLEKVHKYVFDRSKISKVKVAYARKRLNVWGTVNLEVLCNSPLLFD